MVNLWVAETVVSLEGIPKKARLLLTAPSRERASLGQTCCCIREKEQKNDRTNLTRFKGFLSQSNRFCFSFQDESKRGFLTATINHPLLALGFQLTVAAIVASACGTWGTWSRPASKLGYLKSAQDSPDLSRGTFWSSFYFGAIATKKLIDCLVIWYVTTPVLIGK